MPEKRKYTRYPCKIKLSFEFFEGNPDTIDVSKTTPLKGKGFIYDISCGGLFLVSNSRVGINLPIRLTFNVSMENITQEGIIVRTGLIKNNPSEIARKYSGKNISEDSYIAIQFNTPLENLDPQNL
jgi:hypothetical protein